MGKNINRSDQPKRRWKRVFYIAFGQKKMFKKPVPAVLHVLVYVGFLVINIEGIEFFLDGITGRHRTIARFLEKWDLTFFYSTTLNIFEFLAFGVILACIFFLYRRNVLGIKRFSGVEMTQWPRLDANLILSFEILLMFAIMSMNAADQILQERNVIGFPRTGLMLFSDVFARPFYENLSTSSLIVIERTAWWVHIIGIFSFAIYVTYSKHLHTFMAFPNTYYSNLEPSGKITNMNEVTKEVRNMLGLTVDSDLQPGDPVGRLGAKDVYDLTWKNLMDAYTCTECGRCTNQCPANLTGKKLSPRKIMMDTRDRAELLGSLLVKHGIDHTDGKNLLDDYISREEIFACTSCNACVEACPVMIDPLSIILQLRRYLTMEESGVPQDWNAMFSNIENNFSPWKFAPSDRFNWASDLNEKL